MTLAARSWYRALTRLFRKASLIWGMDSGVSRPPSRLRPILMASADSMQTALSRVL